MLAASQGVIADAELESVGLSTLHSCTASQLTIVGSALQVDAALMLETSTTSGASSQKPAAVPWENVPTEHSGWVGHINGGEHQDLPGPGQQAAGYQCGFCVNAAAPGVQALCPRVTLCKGSSKSDLQHKQGNGLARMGPFNVE